MSEKEFELRNSLYYWAGRLAGFDGAMSTAKDIIETISHADKLNKDIDIPVISVSLPSNDEATSEGYRIANDAEYNYRRVLKEPDHDIYYSGWMDCFDWIKHVTLELSSFDCNNEKKES